MTGPGAAVQEPGHPGAGGAQLGQRRPARWLVPAGLLAAELTVLTILGDFPVAGTVARLVPYLRMAVAVALASGVAAWMILRAGEPPGGARASLPPWRPWPSLAAHALAFPATALLTARLWGPGAPPASLGQSAAWLALLAATVLLVLRSAVPLRWLVQRLGHQWGVPALALAAGLLTWKVMVASEGLWSGLASSTLQAVAWLLGLVAEGVTVELPERVIGLRGFEVEIAQHCAGIDGVGLTLIFQAIWIALARSRLRTARALLLLPAGALAALLGNVVRIAALIWLGASGHEELAIGAFHSKVGWVLFAAIALASVAATEHLAWLRRPEPVAAEGGLPAGTAAWIAPLLGALAAAFLGGLVGGRPADPLYVLRIAVPVLILVAQRRWLPRPLVTRSGAAALIGLAVGILWMGLNRGDPGVLAADLAALPAPARWVWIAVRALGSTLVIPLAEELAFRGFLLSWLASGRTEEPGRFWSWPAALASSLAFGALHANWWAGALAGLAFALALRLRGRVGDAVLAHVVANGVVALAAVAGGRWDLWG